MRLVCCLRCCCARACVLIDRDTARVCAQARAVLGLNHALLLVRMTKRRDALAGKTCA
jgi:hypothetical protein